MRHTLVDHLKQKGVEPHYINELMGHSQGNIDLDKYVDSDSDDSDNEDSDNEKLDINVPENI